MAAKLKYKKGDLFANLPDHPVMIPHVCNDEGKWGSGFVLAVNKYSSLPKDRYLTHIENMKRCGNADSLGTTTIARIEDGNYVANMITERGIAREKGDHPLRYFHLMECMKQVRANMNGKNAPKEIYCPKFGSDRAGGHWPTIERMIIECWLDKGIDVTVFEL